MIFDIWAINKKANQKTVNQDAILIRNQVHQDSLIEITDFIETDTACFAVSDGVGSHFHSEEVSRFLLEELGKKDNADLDISGLNLKIYNRWNGTAATLSFLLLSEKELKVIQIGNSMILRKMADQLIKLVPVHEIGGILSMAVGMQNHIAPFEMTLPLYDDESFVLTSDGANDFFQLFLNPQKTMEAINQTRLKDDCSYIFIQCRKK